jgi:methylenetetrahydrofolate reductase (NADPH)
MMDFRTFLGSGNGFAVTCELVPGRGFHGKEIDSIFRFSEAAKDSGEVHAVSLTDNAGGNPAILTDGIARELAEAGVEVIMHFSLKDLNRNMAESRAYALMRQGIRNLLVLSGDYPRAGSFGVSQPVFDLDSVGGLALLKRMNAGMEVTVGTRTRTLEKTDFFLGAVTSPFKWREASSFMQYAKLAKKVYAGARFIISQLGFDSWKHAELIAHARANLGIDIPILGSVYLLTPGAARLMRRGEVPGCFVDDGLLARVEEEGKSADKGRHARLDRAALQVAILKGLGYRGAHIEGLSLSFPEVQEILARSRDLAGAWQDRMEELRSAPARPFYILQGKASEWIEGKPLRLAVTMKRRVPSLLFWLTQALHWLLFHEGTPGHRIMAAASKAAEPHPRLVRAIYGFEHRTKKALFDCRDCGDCMLPDLFFICPESSCAKHMRNGPCGGNRADGHCEAFPDRMCAWERVYWRAKRRDLVQSLQFIVPPRDWSLYRTTSWLSYFLRRDHQKSKVTLPRQFP